MAPQAAPAQKNGYGLRHQARPFDLLEVLTGIGADVRESCPHGRFDGRHGEASGFAASRNEHDAPEKDNALGPSRRRPLPDRGGHLRIVSLAWKECPDRI